MTAKREDYSEPVFDVVDIPEPKSESKKSKARKGEDTASGEARNTAKDTKVINAAVETLHDAYIAVLPPLALVSVEAAKTWSDQIDNLDVRNRAVFENNPKFAAKLIEAAAKASVAAFVVSHVSAIAPVVLVLYREASQRRENES